KCQFHYLTVRQAEPINREGVEDLRIPMIRDIAEAYDGETAQIVEPRRRNDLCPCGSRRRYKHCHGAAAAPFGEPVPIEKQDDINDDFNDAESAVFALEGRSAPIP